MTPSDDPNLSPSLPENPISDDNNWVDGDTPSVSSPSQSSQKPSNPSGGNPTLIMVETAFLASTASLIWLINYFFPLGPVLRLLFPLPIALVYLRRGRRAAWMSALVSGLLLSVLMGPTRSIVFLIPYGLMGVQLGWCWTKQANWGFSIFTGALIGSFGFFFRFWLFSILLGEDLWQYVITQMTNVADWIFLKLGILAQPNFFVVQALAVTLIFINSLVYLFAVHLVALLILDRLGNRIPRPPEWIQALVEYDY
ncbi:MAG: DUF2232 domain-containing protein [Microcystaceae cyanobacterium]